jgi:integrase
VEGYHSAYHSREYRYMAVRWLKRWPDLEADGITLEMVEAFLLDRRKKSALAANKDLRYLKAAFNWGIERGYCTRNPVRGLPLFPIAKRIKKVPTVAEMDQLLSVAEDGDYDYILTLRDTLGRVGEINQLRWDDVFFADGYLVLYTRKKKGGSLTPRKVFLTDRLKVCLSFRFVRRQRDEKWVFTNRYFSRKSGRWEVGPYQDRKGLMRKLCKAAGLDYFRYHAIRHSGASALERAGVPVTAIQAILGHENRLTTEIYLHSISHLERRAMEVFEKLS